MLSVPSVMSNVKCQKSNVMSYQCKMSNVMAHQMSNVILMSNVKYQMSNVKCQMSIVKCQMSNVKCHAMSNVKYKM